MGLSLRLAADEERPAAAFQGMVGAHPAMQDLFVQVRRAAPLAMPVLIQGATGTGKEMVATALHELSGRRGRFVAVNVAAIPEHLAESELFGHVRGAFTGAMTDRVGLIEQAAGGTLYLDEAADLTPAMQAKLLRVVETGLVRPVGATSDRRVQFRLVSSIQQPADELVAAGRWRLDFNYRVAGLELGIPTLAERASDIPLLVDAVLESLGRPPLRLGAETPLERYAWPGNVRELRRVVERAVFMAGSEPVMLAQLVAMLPRLAGGATRPARPEMLPGTLREAERAHIEAALRSARGDVAAAARALGLPKSTLYRRLTALELVPGHYR